MKRIKELRKRQKVTQKQLGAALGVSESTISFYESGKHEPDLVMLGKIADYFDVSTDYLLGRTDIPETVEFDDGYKGPIYSDTETLPPDEVEQGAEGLRHAFRDPQLVIDMRRADPSVPLTAADIELIVERLLDQRLGGHGKHTDH